MCSYSQALMLSCSRSLVLSWCYPFADYRKYRRIIVRNQNASPLNIADERAKRASKAVSWCHALALACSRALVLSHSHALMHSCSRALQPWCRLALVPPSSRIGRNQVTRCYSFFGFSSRLLWLPPQLSLFIPSERIRSLCNSLPVLARTGFENRAPVEAGRPFLELKVP